MEGLCEAHFKFPKVQRPQRLRISKMAGGGLDYSATVMEPAKVNL